MDDHLTITTFAKRLASCNKVARERAIRAFSSWLCRQPDDAAVSDADLLEVWKGLFYCFWYADKLPFQADLADRLAALVETLRLPLALRYFEAFILTMRHEWGGIDSLRLDKFYLLIRKFLWHAFLLLRKNAWAPDLVGRVVGILSEKSLLATDDFLSNGVNHHVSEAFLDEMKDHLPLAENTVDLMLKPFTLVLQKSSDKVLVNKVKVNIFERLLENGRKLLNLMKDGAQVELDCEEAKFGKIALVLFFSKKLFDSASASDTLQGNRKILFALHEGFLKLERDLEKSGIHILSEYLENGESEDVNDTVVSKGTYQVALNGEIIEGASDEKYSNKKTKKPKAFSYDTNGKKMEAMKVNSVSVSEIHVESMSQVGYVVNDENPTKDVMETQEMIYFNECVLPDQQRQFEELVECGICSDQLIGSPAIKTVSANVNKNGEITNRKSAKRVKFSMMSNLVWKPNNPMPPQSLRLPPSVAPNGSALKQGVPPGPIRETPPTVKKIKTKGRSVKKIRIGVNSVSTIKSV